MTYRESEREEEEEEEERLKEISRDIYRLGEMKERLGSYI